MFRRMGNVVDKFETERTALGRAMRRIRTRKGLTQEQVAANMQTYAQQVQRWEASERLPRKQTLPKIAAALEISLDDLMAERARAMVASTVNDFEGPAATDLTAVYGFAAGAGESITLTTGSELRWVAKHPAQYGYRRTGVAEVIGESMYPRWKPRELAYFVFDLAPPRGGDVIVEMNSGEALIKEYVGRRVGRDGQPDRLQLKEFYPEERVFEIDASDVRALHAVVG